MNSLAIFSGRFAQDSLLGRLARSVGTSISAVLIFGIALYSGNVQAGFCVNPATFPETIEVQITNGQTSLLLGEPFSGFLYQVDVAVSGNLVTLDLYIFDACQVVPPPPQTHTVQIGFLPAGTYALRVRNHYTVPDVPLEVNRSFVVGSEGVGAAFAVPADSPWVLALLVIVLSGLGVMRLRNL